MNKIHKRLETFLLSKGFSEPDQVTGAPGRLKPNEEYLELSPPMDWHSGRITHMVAEYFRHQELQVVVDGGDITVSQNGVVVYKVSVTVFNLPQLAIFVGSNTDAVCISIFHMHPVIRSYKNSFHRLLVQILCFHDWDSIDGTTNRKPPEIYGMVATTKMCTKCSREKVEYESID